MTYLEAYVALTDEELTELASAGLLRRARKLSDDVAESGSDVKGADLTIAGHRVRVDARGPAAVTCECPTGGVCVHVVAAWRWARARAADLGVEAPHTATGPGRAGGPGHGDGGPAAVGEPGPDVAGTERPAVDGSPGGGGAGRGAEQADPGPRGGARRSAAAVRRATAKESAAAKRRAVAVAEVRDAVVHLLDGGLAHLRDDAPESLRALAGRARVAGFEPVHGLRLDALLRTAAGQAADLAAHADGTDESGILATLAEIWALCEVHDHTGPGGGAGSGAVHAPGRRKTASRSGQEEDEIDLARLVPLGARWWTTPSGSRGLAFAAWDPGAGRVRTAVTGRPAGADPSFRREWEAPLLWGASPARLNDGPFSLSAVRARPDGTLGAGGSPRLAPLGAFDPDELREIAERTGTGRPARETVGFGRRPSHLRLLLVRDTGEIGVDEVRQDLTWDVTDSTGQGHQLRVPVEDRRTAEVILHVLAGRWAVVAVSVERRADRTEPVGIFLRGTDGVVRLISPSLTDQYQLGRDSRWSRGQWQAWRKRLSRVAGMRSRARAVTEAPEPDPPAVRACGLAWDVLVAVAATGRYRLTPRQRSDLDLARTLARDLGLSTLERCLSDLVPDDGAAAPTGGSGGSAMPGPGTLARTAFLVHRTREVLSAA
ncbi:hypothetical protein [Myceligenerans salitolerans]|uniref:SWIM-type domain-containing protein n=1 Tax=Myceligenerans salitolerans TaxID=1230528 RepID=A0ABS3ID23_9MICO|nr:hypothetical protein [Myceligenerans salitolerans]MBO0610869.1 hypothetical protein [Myceligenerans salitolerans]